MTHKEKSRREILPEEQHQAITEMRSAYEKTISELKQAEEALRKNENFYKENEQKLKHSHELMRYIIEHNKSAVAVHDKDLNYIYVSQRYLDEYQVKDPDIIGKHHYEVFPDLPQKWREVHKKALQGEVCSADNDIYHRADGTVEWTRWECRPWYESDGAIGGIIIYTEIITERKQAEEEILRLNENLEALIKDRTAKLQASIKELEAFSYSVSHDLRAPLRHISGYVALLNKQFKDLLPEKAQHYLNTVSDAARQMGELIDNLLQFSRTGRQEMRESPTDMNALVQEVVEGFKNDAKERNINWTIGRLPEAISDASLMKQVWFNLIENAVKYSRGKKTANITIGHKSEADNFVFFIRDNGTGFDMKHLHNIFGVFQRLHSQEEFEGTGIGLAIAQRIVHKHGGRVWAEAEPGNGATFYFSLPKTKKA